TVDMLNRPAPHRLRFSPQADDALREFETWLEPQLAQGEELSHLAGWANKLPGAVARLAGILHMADEVGKGEGQQVISVPTVQAAVRLGKNYLLPHAQAAFGLMGADPRVEVAHAVLTWLSIEYERRRNESRESGEHGGPTFSRRDIHQGRRKRFRTVDDVD